jgi:hypothetical protein
MHRRIEDTGAHAVRRESSALESSEPAAIRADPDDALGIDVDRTNGSRGHAVGHAVVREPSVRVAADAEGRANPERFSSADEGTHIVADEAIGSAEARPLSVLRSDQAAVRSEPQGAVAVAIEHRDLLRSLLRRDRNLHEPASLRAPQVSLEGAGP